MGINFPSSPTVGDQYPTPPVIGVPTYSWDGEKWVTAISPSSGGAPFDAMSYSGMQINGGMEVSQERGTAGTSANFTYICDGWYFLFSGTMGVTGAQYAGGTFGLPNSIGITVNTAQASLSGSDATQLQQRIEGYRVSRLAWGTSSAKPITISFWTAHHRTGTYSVGIRNGTGARSYVTTYTQNVADTYEFKTVTILGDISGTWIINNGIGLILDFTIASGPTNIVPTANTWTAGSYFAAPGQVNGVAATNDAFRITGVVVLPGSQAPTAAQSPLIMRPYDQELATCMRYYERQNTLLFRAQVTGSVFFWLPAHVRKRSTPTVTLANASYSNGSAGTIGQANLDGAEITFSASAAAGSGFITCDAILDARL